MDVTTSVTAKTAPPPTPLDGGLGSTWAAIGGTQGVVALSLIALPAQAAGTVYIEKMYYSSLGVGDGSNSTLNAEYEVIRNGDTVPHHHWVDRAGCGGSPPYVRHPPVASWHAGNGSCRRLPRVRFIRDDAVTGRVG